jgi:putative transposase
MPRPPRADEAGAIYHAHHRGNARQTIFHKDEDFGAFERVISENLESFDIKLCSYQWLGNHRHEVSNEAVLSESRTW